MRTFTVPAMYAPLIIHALKHLADVRVEGHQSLERLQANSPDDADTCRALASMLVDEAELDRSLPGDLVITIATLPEDANVLAFPIPMKVAS